jgi:hypothetical protein
MFIEINQVFNEYLPVVMCCMVLAMLTVSTYLLTAVSFFCYLFFNLIFNYVNLIEKLEMKVESRLLPMVLSLISSCWIVVFFIGVLIRVEYQ